MFQIHHFLFLLLSLCLIRTQLCDSPLDIAIVIDSSSSLDGASWNQSKAFLQTILPLINSTNSRGSIFQYSQNASIESNLTNNWSILNETLLSLSLFNDSSLINTGNAISVAWKYLQNLQRATALPMVLLLTGGEPNDDIISAANSIKKQGGVIVIVGIDGARSSNSLASAASSSLFFPSNANETLSNLFLSKVVSALCFSVTGVVDRETNNISFAYSVELLSAKEILIVGQGFFDDSSCQFNSPNSTYSSPLINYNSSLGSCQVPDIADNYSLTVLSIYWKTLTKAKILVSVKLSELISQADSAKICQGDSLDFNITGKLRDNWRYRQDDHTLNYSVSKGCSSNNDCPYDNYCFNCSLCQGDCPGCPSSTGGSCYPLKNCFSRKDAIESCGKSSNSCDCADSHYPFTDSSYLTTSSLGCSSSNQCYLQDSLKCALPHFSVNSQSLRKCQPEVDNEVTLFCEWTDGNTPVTLGNLELFTEFLNQTYSNPADSNLALLKISNQNMNIDACYQKCLQTKECSGLEYPDDESYCGLWLNSALKSEANFWSKGFLGKTLRLKQYENFTILIPAIYKNENTLSCPIPSRFSINANLLKVRILQQNSTKSGFIPLTEYNKWFQWSFCSNCYDLFAENYDSLSIYKDQQQCSYQDSQLTQKSTIDGTPEFLFATRGKISPPTSGNISWSDFGRTNSSIYGFYVYINYLRYTQKANNSLVRLYIRNAASNQTFQIFDSDFYKDNYFNNSDLTNKTFNTLKLISRRRSTDEFKPIVNNGQETVLQIGVEVNSEANDQVEISGVTLVITDWGTLSSKVKSLIPSKFVVNCTQIQGANSQRFNKSVAQWEIILRKAQNESFPILNIGDLFSSLGCYKLGGTFIAMPAFIKNITVTDPNTLNLTLFEEVIFTDIFSFAKIDSVNQKVLSLSEALKEYENVTINETESVDDEWLFRSKINDSISDDNSSVLSYRQISILKPRLSAYVNDSKVIKGSFSLEAKSMNKMSFKYNSSKNAIRRRLSLPSYNIEYVYTKSDLLKEYRFLSFDIPLGGLVYLGTSGSVRVMGSSWQTDNIIASRGSVSAISRISYDMTKNLVTSEAIKTSIDFLPMEIKELHSTTVEFKINQDVVLDFNFLNAGFINAFHVTSTLEETNDFCGGLPAGTQSFQNSLTSYLHLSNNEIAYIKDVESCNKVLGKVCAPLFSAPKSNRRRFLSQNLIPGNNDSFYKLGSVSETFGACRIQNTLSQNLQFLDALKNNTTSLDTIPSNAVDSWPTIDTNPPSILSCPECQIIVPPGSSNVLIPQSYFYDKIYWGSISPDLSGSIPEPQTTSTNENLDLTAENLLAYGDPHIHSFSGVPYNTNEVGDFYLFRLRGPLNGSQICNATELLIGEELELAKELESYDEISQDFIGAQIRFLPGVWSPEISLPVALGVKIGDEKVEFLQSSNGRRYDVRVLVNGLEYDTSITLKRMNIMSLTLDNSAFVITSKYFKIKWTPSSVTVSLSKFITNSGSNDPGCMIRTDGLAGLRNGDILDDNLKSRFGVYATLISNQTEMKEFVNSWRVFKNETVISNWLPMYSDNSTRSYPLKAISSLHYTTYINAIEKCRKYFDLELSYQIDLLDKGCWNPILNNLRALSPSLSKGCAYDILVTNSSYATMNFLHQIKQLKLAEPIACLAPLAVLAQNQILTQNKSFSLKVFHTAKPNTILASGYEFDMGAWANGTIDAISNLSVSNANGSVQMNFTKRGTYLVKVAGYYKPYTVDYVYYYLDSGNLQVQPGMNEKVFWVTYNGTEDKGADGEGNFNIKLVLERFWQILVLGLIILVGA